MKEVKGVSSLGPYHWEMLGASLESDCRGSLSWLLILSPRTVPNVSAYRPDYLFQTVTGVWGGHPIRSRLSKDLQDGLLIAALGNGPMQD